MKYALAALTQSSGGALVEVSSMGEFVRDMCLFSPVRYSTLGLRLALWTVTGEMSGLSTLEADCIVCGGPWGILGVSSLGSSSSHRTSTSRRSP